MNACHAFEHTKSQRKWICYRLVRIDETAMFKKATENRWSDEVHVVQSASGKSVTLTDGTTYKRDKLLMAPHNTVIAPNTEKNIIKVATKQHKDNLYFKREDINEANIIEGKRKREYKTWFLKPKIAILEHFMTILLLYIIV